MGVIYIRYEMPGKSFTVPYTIKEIQNWVDVGYAITVHKAQGSEARCVILANNKGNLARNMLYTAITRARDKIYLLGSGWKLAAKNPRKEPLSKFIFHAKNKFKSSLSKGRYSPRKYSGRSKEGSFKDKI